MNTTTIKIPIHSFVDVITNSSSEIFVVADDNTKVLCKDLINNFLSMTGSDKKADDLFDIKLVCVLRCEETDHEDMEFQSEQERTNWCNEHDVDEYGDYVVHFSYIRVTSKSDDPAVVSVANGINSLLNSLSGIECSC